MKECRRVKEMAGGLNRDQVIADALMPPEIIINSADGYSTDEIAALQEFVSNQEAH